MKPAHVSNVIMRPALWAIQAGIFLTSGVCAFLLRFDLTIPATERSNLLIALAIWFVGKSIVFRLCRVHRDAWRYVSVQDVVRLCMVNVIASAVTAAVVHAVAPTGFPRSVYLLDLALCVLATAGIRVAVRTASDRRAYGSLASDSKKICVYGAGKAGIAVLREIRENPTLGFGVAGFIDDDPRKAGLYIQRVPLLGSGSDLRKLASSMDIHEVLIAIPSATGQQMAAIIKQCHDAGLRCKTVPSMTELIQGSGLASQIRDVAVEDLLGRSAVMLDESTIRDCVQNRVVMVTGAAGSIGSELCRQLARFSPARIVAFEIAESPLFNLQQEITRTVPGVAFCPEIGNVQNKRRLAEVFEAHRPSMVFHAAAYKHVPLMEAHVFEAIENNVFGTLNVALAANTFGVERFVLISSDKAVHPANIMGATKSLAEFIVRSLQSPANVSKFASVRFGNVLGSNGSVVPLFKEQIARGGPVTITHPEMRRYFMTIPEASQLVLQAATMASGGEIFVLDMGEPVRITDLATNLILLSGFRPEQIKISYTGVRSGEKLYEELSTGDENVLPTSHNKIKVFESTTVPWSALQCQLERLAGACAARDINELIVTLKDAVPEYNPSSAILRRVLTRSAGESTPTVSRLTQPSPIHANADALGAALG